MVSPVLYSLLTLISIFIIPNIARSEDTDGLQVCHRNISVGRSGSVIPRNLTKIRRGFFEFYDCFWHLSSEGESQDVKVILRWKNITGSKVDCPSSYHHGYLEYGTFNEGHKIITGYICESKLEGVVIGSAVWVRLFTVLESPTYKPDFTIKYFLREMDANTVMLTALGFIGFLIGLAVLILLYYCVGRGVHVNKRGEDTTDVTRVKKYREKMEKHLELLGLTWEDYVAGESDALEDALQRRHSTTSRSNTHIYETLTERQRRQSEEQAILSPCDTAGNHVEATGYEESVESTYLAFKKSCAPTNEVSLPTTASNATYLSLKGITPAHFLVRDQRLSSDEVSVQRLRAEHPVCQSTPAINLTIPEILVNGEPLETNMADPFNTLSIERLGSSHDLKKKDKTSPALPCANGPKWCLMEHLNRES